MSLKFTPIDRQFWGQGQSEHPFTRKLKFISQFLHNRSENINLMERWDCCEADCWFLPFVKHFTISHVMIWGHFALECSFPFTWINNLTLDNWRGAGSVQNWATYFSHFIFHISNSYISKKDYSAPYHCRWRIQEVENRGRSSELFFHHNYIFIKIITNCARSELIWYIFTSLLKTEINFVLRRIFTWKTKFVPESNTNECWVLQNSKFKLIENSGKWPWGWGTPSTIYVMSNSCQVGEVIKIMFKSMIIIRILNMVLPC